MATRLTTVECVLRRRVGEHDVLYGSVTAADIAECLAGQQVEVDKRKLVLEEPLKRLGEFLVPIKLYRDVIGQVKVMVVKLEEWHAPVTRYRQRVPGD